MAYDLEKHESLRGQETWREGAKENDGLLQKEERAQPGIVRQTSFSSSLTWMVINTLATIGIVLAAYQDPLEQTRVTN